MSEPQTPEPAPGHARGAYPFASCLRALCCWRTIRPLLFVAACLATLIALFYAVEDWRGRRAWETCRRELEAKGEVIDWNAFIPAPVPDGQNIYKAPRMTEWFVKGSLPEAVSGAASKSGKAEEPFKLLPHSDAEHGPLLVAELQFAPANGPLPPGKPDAVLRLDDPAAPEQTARLFRGRIGPCVEGPRACVIAARPLDQVHPLYLVLQADKMPTVKALEDFLFPDPLPRSMYNISNRKFFEVETAGTNGFLVSLQKPIYGAAEYIELSQPAVPDLDVVRKALERPYARMDSDYQRPYEHPIPNFVRLRTVAQLQAQRAQCYLLLGQPEAAWHELELVRGLCHMLEARPASNCPTLVEAMIDVAIGGLYVNIIQDGMRWQVWREPELAAIQKQLGEMDFIPLVQRAFQAERAATCRTFETYSPSDLKKLFSFGNQPHNWYEDLKNPAFLFATFAPRGWMFRNMCAGAPQNLGLLRAFDPKNNLVLPSKLEDASRQMGAALKHKTPYNFLAAMAFPNFLRATQTMARNQTLANEAYIACGLERYRLAHKQYPRNLAELVPQFAPKLPHDIIGGQPLKYERTADDRFELYSVGWNGKDDGGLLGKTIAEGDWVWQ